MAWKAKSFTDGDITLHFILFDILYDPDESFSLAEITGRIDKYLSQFSEPRVFDESTVRKKLKEYVKEGIVVSRKNGKTVFYNRAAYVKLSEADIIDFFSEVAPCGVVGSFLLDKINAHEDHFTFKHHYITGAMDSDVVCGIFVAMGEKRSVALECINRNKNRITVNHVLPLKLMISAQNGRQYLMGYAPDYDRILSFRWESLCLQAVLTSVSGTYEFCRRYHYIHLRTGFLS